MKIIIAEPTGHGKLSHYSFNLCQALAGRGNQVTLVTATNYELVDEEPTFAIKRFFPSHHLSLTKYRELFKFITRPGADILHFQWVPSAPFIIFLIAYKRSLAGRLIYTAHNVLPHRRRFYHKYFYRLLYRGVDKVIAHSEVDRQKIIDLFGLDEKKITVIPIGNTIKAAAISQSAARRELGLKEEKTLLFFGYITPDKGLEVLLKALLPLTNAGPKFKLIVAGKADNKRDLAELVKDYKLSGQTLLDTRYVPKDKAALYFRAADILVLPYLKANQSPLIPLAYSYGLPVVATSVQIEKVVDGETGYLVPPNDAKSLSLKLRLLLNDESKLERMSKAAQELSEREYSWAGIAAKTLAVYTNP